MAVTAFPSLGNSSPDLTLLNTARLFTRLEHNLLTPGSELRTLRGSEFQRMRITKNLEYARTLLSQLERSLPQLKSLERKHEVQEEVTRDRQLLKRMQAVLDEEDARANDNDNDNSNDNDNETEVDTEWADLFAKPVAEKILPAPNSPSKPQIYTENKDKEQRDIDSTTTPTSTPAYPSTSTSTAAPPTSTAPPTLRNRSTNQKPQTSLTDSTAKAKASGSSTSASTSTPANKKEQELSTHRLEQEDLTSSLVALASQLKASSQSFQTTLENEQSVLDRAVTGMDKTSATMEAAGKRMGMLRKMSEGKGWWGRMMLYAWIFGLWVVAILIVYVLPKLRF
ncbi:hypothetical protein N7466_011634 [Penicillium verhagenii]|uniref:uncharacterized protein n=1 Tax=Penicillium verhagenii TaxID=1562060 RepID=UPI00254516DB|nr:uncharacterized protein N7466_011634 [Penicillium verhagenii]KAJ5915701.1 hypothetical protein N7466_011634 [Penicillium verhagenii]